MLPDYPALKKELEYMLQLGARAASLSGSSVPIPRRDVYEGNRHALVRENGETVEDTYDTLSSGNSLKAPEAEKLSLGQTYAMYTSMMNEMGKKEETALVKLANDEAESRGQVVEGAGRPLPEAVMKAVEKMELDPAPRDVDHLFLFQNIRFMLHELDEEIVEKTRRELKQEPYRARIERLLEKKREEHRARESSRKLVG